VRDRRVLVRLLALLMALALVAAACGGDDDDEEGADTGTDDTEAPDEGGGEEGGELVDLGTFVGDPPEHLDPALNSTLDAYQIVNALFDGLTDIDSSDPEDVKIVPHLAESYEANDDATVWTFKIREGQTFSDGEEILPSTFQKSWERASDPDFAGDYSYLFNFIEGGAEKLDGTAETMSGIEADDENMTLTVTLSAPYSNFDAVAGFQLFFPVHSSALEDPAGYENGMMIGNGPFMLESPRTEQEIVLVRNENWTTGDIHGNTRALLDKITFRVSADPDTAYNAFEAGEGDTGQIPPGRVTEADENYGTTLSTQILGSYHFLFKMDGDILGGDENVKLRQAISLAIDREEINEAVYDNSRSLSTGVVPPGIPGAKEGIGEYAATDAERAQELFDEWTAEGGTLDGPIPIQFNAGAGHEDVVQIFVDNLAQIGIEAVAEPMATETYFSELADGACKAICRAGWFADYPAYDNFMYDLFHGDSANGGNNYGNYNDEEFNRLVDEGKATVDKDEQAELFQQAESILLNEDTAVLTVNWYRGDYVFNEDKLNGFVQTNFGLIPWETISINS
jgi:oligopeptide transport system substrate-binding protein